MDAKPSPVPLSPRQCQFGKTSSCTRLFSRMGPQRANGHNRSKNRIFISGFQKKSTSFECLSDLVFWGPEIKLSPRCKYESFWICIGKGFFFAAKRANVLRGIFKLAWRGLKGYMTMYFQIGLARAKFLA